MHPCLNVAEIVQNIAENVFYRVDALHLGMTCRAFLDPGMAVAWRYRDMEELVRVLPENRRGSTWKKQLVSFLNEVLDCFAVD